MELVRLDRSYGDDAGRKGLLKVFEILGDNELVSRYRRQMFNAMH
jgi:putative thioredoxin